MDQQSVSSSAKKSIILVFLIIAAGLFVLFLIAKGPKGIKIIGVGDAAPEFRLAALDGRLVSLSDFRGKITMVHFWATWCPSCVEEMPTLEMMYRQFSGQEFQLFAVSVDEDGPASVVPFIQRNKLSVPVLLDPDRSSANRYGTFKFPETYVLDRNGIVQYKVIGPRDWTDPATVKALQDIIASR